MGTSVRGAAPPHQPNRRRTRGVRARHTPGAGKFPALRCRHEPTPKAGCRLLMITQNSSLRWTGGGFVPKKAGIFPAFVEEWRKSGVPMILVGTFCRLVTHKQRD